MRKKTVKIGPSNGILLILPSLIGFSFFYLVPFIIGIYYVFTRSVFDSSFAGFSNFIELFNSESFVRALLNTLKFTFISVPSIIFISLLIAVLLIKNRKTDKYINIYLMPLIVPVGSTVLVWRLFFDRAGTLNYVLNVFGLSNVNWLESGFAVFIVLLMFLWKNTGFHILLFLTGLAGIRQEYYEAAKIEGAGGILTFRRITMPILLPTFFLSMVLSIISSFKVFKETYLLSGNYPHKSMYMLQHYVNNMFRQLDYNKLMTSAYVILFILAITALAFMKLGKRTDISEM